MSFEGHSQAQPLLPIIYDSHLLIYDWVKISIQETTLLYIFPLEIRLVSSNDKS